MIITGSNIILIKEVKNILSSDFNMKDLGIADNILGVKIVKISNG